MTVRVKKETRICRLCGQEKAIDLFEIDKRVKGSRTNRCKSCKSSLEDKAQRAYRHLKQRAERDGVPVEVTINQLKGIYKAHDGRCIYCGATEEETGKTHHLDHVTPISRNGRHHSSNLVIACEHHNLSKGDKPLITFYLENEREDFSDESLAAITWCIALSNGQPVKEVVNKLLEEHAEYIIEQNFKGMDKLEAMAGEQ